MLNNLQFLSFEISPTCNMSNVHSWCPINDPLRYPRHESRVECSNEAIINFTKIMYLRGFKGQIAFHYYSDPLMNINRLLYLIQQIRDMVPASEFILWTNGILLNNLSKNWLHIFKQIMITLHNPKDKDRLQNIVKDFTNVRFHDDVHDDRLSMYDCQTIIKDKCFRPLRLEMPINFYGNVRLCCSEFRGQVSIGNIQSENADDIIDSFIEAAKSASEGIIPICWKCRGLVKNTVVI